MKIIDEIAQEISLLGGRCFFVGGYVRDQVLQMESHDYDIECFHLTLTELETVLKKFGPLRTVGKQFGILKLDKYHMIDFSLPRSEQKIGTKHTDFEILIQPNLAYKEAARRRDFTCNALMKDVITGEILDFFNGLEAIEQKKLIHIDSQTFVEDPLRGLRAAQFAARLNFSIAPSTIELIQQLDYSALSIERIQNELHKGLLFSQVPSQFITSLNDLTISPKLLPQLWQLACKNKNAMAKILQQLDQLKNLLITPTQQLISFLAIFALYLPLPQKFLALFTTNKTDRSHALKLSEHFKSLSILSDDTTYRKLKNQLIDVKLFETIAPMILNNDAMLLPVSCQSATDFMNNWTTAICNNPSNKPLVQGRHLIALGISPSRAFSIFLHETRELEETGLTFSEIIDQFKKTHEL